MLFDLGKLVRGAPLPPLVETVLAVAEVLVVVGAVAKELCDDEGGES